MERTWELSGRQEVMAAKELMVGGAGSGNAGSALTFGQNITRFDDGSFNSYIARTSTATVRRCAPATR